MRFSSWKWAGGLLAMLAVCSAPAPAQADDLVGLTKFGTLPLLVGLDSDDPMLPTSVQLVTGLAANDQLVAMDLRPATGQIYGVGHNKVAGTLQLYRINNVLVAAVAAPVGARFNAPTTRNKVVEFGFDFNPTIDRVRLVADNDLNIVFHPDTGDVTTATNLFYAAGAGKDPVTTPPDPITTRDVNAGKNPNVVHIAYDNNDLDPATGSQQRGIDSKLGVLVTVANNTGRLRTIGSLGVRVSAIGGFDVSSTGNNQSFAIMTPIFARNQMLYTINNNTGRATPVGIPLMGLFQITGLTVLETPVAPPSP